MIVNCPVCGKKTAFLNNVCEHCGCAIKVCEECGNVVEDSKSSCDYCGYEFLSKEVKEEKAKQEEKEAHEKKQRETATAIIEYAYRKNKLYNVLSHLFFLSSAIFLILGFLSWGDGATYGPSSFNLLLSETQQTVNVLLAIVFVIWSTFFILQHLKPVLLSRTIFSKVKLYNFDYITYYKNLSTAPNGKIYMTLGHGDIVLLDAIRYSTEATLKKRKILWTFILSAVMICGFVLLYLGLRDNINAWTLFSVLGKTYHFELNAKFIIGVVLIIAYIIASLIDNRRISQDQVNWVKKIKQQ